MRKFNVWVTSDHSCCYFMVVEAQDEHDARLKLSLDPGEEVSFVEEHFERSN